MTGEITAMRPGGDRSNENVFRRYHLILGAGLSALALVACASVPGVEVLNADPGNVSCDGHRTALDFETSPPGDAIQAILRSRHSGVIDQIDIARGPGGFSFQADQDPLSPALTLNPGAASGKASPDAIFINNVGDTWGIDIKPDESAGGLVPVYITGTCAK